MELNIGSTDVYKVIHQELHMNKLVCLWVPYDLPELEKAKRVKICKVTQNLLIDDGQHLISKIITGEEHTYSFLTSQYVNKVKYGSL